MDAGEDMRQGVKAGLKLFGWWVMKDQGAGLLLFFTRVAWFVDLPGFDPGWRRAGWWGIIRKLNLAVLSICLIFVK
jgi:hypothetical protein